VVPDRSHAASVVRPRTCVTRGAANTARPQSSASLPNRLACGATPQRLANWNAYTAGLVLRVAATAGNRRWDALLPRVGAAPTGAAKPGAPLPRRVSEPPPTPICGWGPVVSPHAFIRSCFVAVGVFGVTFVFSGCFQGV
jgi:hypothetical protein